MSVIRLERAGGGKGDVREEVGEGLVGGAGRERSNADVVRGSRGGHVDFLCSPPRSASIRSVGLANDWSQ